MPVGVAVVGDELDVRSALGHATDEGEVTAYGPRLAALTPQVIVNCEFMTGQTIR